jgi:acetyl-CoA carboxylase carboxyl transferase subunit beta
VEQRIDLICDRHSFAEFSADLRSSDPLSFKDKKKYKERLKEAERKTGSPDAVKAGRARIEGKPVVIGIFDFAFMGGSMGIVVGEKLTQVAEIALEEKVPAIIVSASGGARMQEGLYSLMQMAKVTSALSRLSEAQLPYISVLTDPTTGGVAASFAMLGDINVAEPGALIGFAGPRVIEQTIKSTLPEGFQRSEFLVEHGMVDLIVHRDELKQALSRFITYLSLPQ